VDALTRSNPLLIAAALALALALLARPAGGQPVPLVTQALPPSHSPSSLSWERAAVDYRQPLFSFAAPRYDDLRGAVANLARGAGRSIALTH
jgi:hypothetical protein